MNLLKNSCLVFLLGGILLCGTAAMAADALWQSPSAVQLSPQGARITVDAQATATLEKGQARVVLYIPADAQHLDIQPATGKIMQWSSTLERVDALSGSTASRRAALLHEKSALQGRIAAVQARMTLWATPPSTALPQDQMTARQTSLDTVLPAAQQELDQQQAALREVDAQLAGLPDTPRQAQKIVAVLDAMPQPATMSLRYAYTLDNCGWQADYRFNAEPDTGKIRVNFFAKVWQFSGVNWDNAHITLVSQSVWQREPNTLRPWHVYTGDDVPTPPMQSRARAVPMSLAAAMPEAENDAAPKVMQAPRMQDSTAFTSWDLGKRDLPEGTLRLSITQDTWDSPLQWLARPSLSTHVWLTAKQTLVNPRAWPAGEASFSIDGVAVGTGTFKVKGDSATLYFGVDPRVTVLSETDPRQSGKEGLIDKRKTWDWTWQYTVVNSRTSPVEIRIEEPAPQPADKALTVTYSSKPAPQQGPDHTLYWDITVPAESKHVMSHTVTLTAPQNMKVRPGR